MRPASQHAAVERGHRARRRPPGQRGSVEAVREVAAAILKELEEFQAGKKSSEKLVWTESLKNQFEKKGLEHKRDTATSYNFFFWILFYKILLILQIF